ncbi:hypothetical protein ACRYCC_09160 [Actinomadura scrupuli]|uniref:hypothetical protein n=1 Tax=Actinomadura scrupuli TaxID=559629 RepID=UPI003D99E381
MPTIPFRRRVSEGTAWDDPALTAGLPDVRKGRLEAGRRLLAETRGDHDLRALRLGRLSMAAIPHREALARLYAENPGDADLALWLGDTRISHAWEVRGGQWASRVSADQFEEFWLILGTAYDPLIAASELLVDDPVPWDRLQWHGLGTQRGRAELDEIWAELHRRGPDFYTGHYSRLQVLCGKWKGSDAEVLDFAETAAKAAPPGSPIAAIPVAAHLEVLLVQGISPAGYFRQPAVQTRLAELSDAWSEHVTEHPRVPEAHHLFGAAFYLGGDWLRARRHLSQVSAGSIPGTLPWSYLGEGRGYLEARKELGLSADSGPILEPGPLPTIPAMPRVPRSAQAGERRQWAGAGGVAAVVVFVVLIRLAVTISNVSSSADAPRDQQASAAETPPIEPLNLPELPDAVAGMVRTNSPYTRDLADTFTRLLTGGETPAGTAAGVYWAGSQGPSVVTVIKYATDPGSVPASLVNTSLANLAITETAAYPTGTLKGTLRCGRSAISGVVCVWAGQATEIAVNFDKSSSSTSAAAQRTRRIADDLVK